MIDAQIPLSTAIDAPIAIAHQHLFAKLLADTS